MKRKRFLSLYRLGAFGGVDLSEAYRLAVIDDGGTIESEGCVSGTFESLNAVQITDVGAFDYKVAVVADGGTLESFTCVKDNFLELNNVAV